MKDLKTVLKELPSAEYVAVLGTEEDIALPLFSEEEIEKAEPIIHALQGMTISSANELLSKVGEALMQVKVFYA